jgi:FkbM family methyltransferase
MEAFLNRFVLFFGVCRVTGLFGAFRVLWDMKIRKRNIINFRYKGDLLRINNDDSALYNIAYSAQKLENMAMSVKGECDTVIDIGANAGLFAYFIKKKFPRARIYLFEPSADLKEVIAENMRDFEDWRLTEKAVTDTDGFCDFFVNPRNQQTNSLNGEITSVFSGKGDLVKKKIPSVTLDAFVRGEGLEKIDVIKLDVQGAELQVLKKAEYALSVCGCCLCEFCFFDQGVFDIGDIIARLKRRFENYEVINEIKMGADVKFYGGQK